VGDARHAQAQLREGAFGDLKGTPTLGRLGIDRLGIRKFSEPTPQ
jgi:hypothetical protein